MQKKNKDNSSPVAAAAAAKSLQSCLTLMIPWTVAHQVPLSMGFSRQEYWNGMPFPSPGDLPDPGIEPGSSSLQTDFSPLSHQGSPAVSHNNSNLTLSTWR